LEGPTKQSSTEFENIIKILDEVLELLNENEEAPFNFDNDDDADGDILATAAEARMSIRIWGRGCIFSKRLVNS
jgi:hypothetical protein